MIRILFEPLNDGPVQVLLLKLSFRLFKEPEISLTFSLKVIFGPNAERFISVLSSAFF
jgi:hypothetical protein